MVNTNPITYPCGKENMGGYKPFVLFVPTCAVSTVPTLPKITDESQDEHYIKAIGAFTFKKEDGKALYIQCTDKTVKCDAETQGEIEGQSFNITGEFYRAGSEERYSALARQINNTSGYLILEELNGEQIIVGQPGLPCLVKPSMEGGMTRTDRRGYKFTFQADSVAPKVYLETKIDIDDLLS